jgi:hypothetical protein
MKIKVSLQGIIIPFLCFVLFSSAAFGQEETEQTGKTLHYGIKAGPTLSTFSSEQPHNNFKPGFTAGVFINYPLSSSFSLQIEPAYFQQGGNLISIYDYSIFLIPDPPFLLEVKDQKVTYHNIDVPLLLKYEKEVGGLKFFCDAGPSIGFNLNTNIITHVSARSSSDPDEIPVYYNFREEENISSNIETLQYGVTGGLGFEVPMGNHSLIFDIKYRYGLNKTWPGYSYLGIAPVQGDLKTNTLYFTLGFGF